MSATMDDMLDLMQEAGIPQEKIDTITAERSLFEQGIDSFDFVALAVAVEKRFSISMAEIDAGKLRSLNDLIRLVNDR